MSTQRIGYAGGAYDLFHIGHLNILKHARSQCDHLIAGVVTDEILEITKGKTPIIPYAERIEIVRNISFVDEVVEEDVMDKLDAWRTTRFNVYFKGDDWKGTERAHLLEIEFAKVGVDVVYFPYTMATSSTLLRRALEKLMEPSLQTGTGGSG
ncbi:adenylyltransferase/cytidyltransferase family protein [Cryobacterium sp. TMT2-14]|uniref:adenylyltransferase/cytidyltransferase family protein n=1 Tax=Cryobacterium sp. TMT2-14 TaxID=1259245 RepID=UPI0018E08E03|nr:adenylyltransferase/cytidyltransferase family protein [Cryobacterium sp. TMT2-14]